MAINKNFVVKNGLEVNTQLIYADADTNNVGIASTQPRVELDVRGGIAATNTTVSGISTIATELRVGSGIAGTVFTVLGIDNLVGVGTSQPAYVLDVRAPVSTGQTALYVQGDVRITGDINLDDINLDYAEIGHMVVSAASTFSGDLDINADIDVSQKSRLNELEVSGLSTFSSNVDINADLDVNRSVSINSGLAVTGISTFTGLVDINGGVNVTGISTFDNDVLVSETLSVTGGLAVTGLSTFTGIGTFLGDLYIGGDLYVADDLTFDQFTAREASITGLATAANLEVIGITTLGNVKVFVDGTGGIVTATSGIITYYGDGQFLQNIVSGVGIASTNPSTGYSEIVGYGATVLTFAGPGVSTAYPITVNAASGIATIHLEGGGSGGGYQTNIEKDSYTVGSGGTDTFTTSNPYETGYVDVFINGSRLPSSDFTETDSTTVTLNDAAVEGDVVELVNFRVIAITGEFETQITKEEFTVTSATQSVFDLSNTYTSGYIDVYLNGVKLSSSDFTETDTDTITLTTAAKLGDIVQFVNFERRAISEYLPLWRVNETVGVTGIHTLTTVGIGTSIPTAFVDIRGGLNVVGPTTSTSFVGDLTGTASTATSAATAYSLVGIATAAADLTGSPDIVVSSITVGTAISAFSNGLEVAGIITATSFVGDGSSLNNLNIPAGFNELDAALFN
jgi:hypothetical protein